jgi:formate--tetrahydrofolate ligase
LGLKTAEYCVVEAGFASDLGAEKFVDIVTRAGGFDANVAVVVATLRALKHQGGESSENIILPNQRALNLGLENLRKHIENVRILGLEPVVAINKFPTDISEELKQVEQFCRSQGVSFAVSTPFENGGVGAIELAERVVEASAKNRKSKPLYSLADSIEIKLSLIVKKIYGGTGIDFGADVKKDSEWIAKLGLADNPICVAKTQLSLSDDPRKLGRPVNFTVFLRKINPAAGAGFNVAYMGDIVTMPGLPKHPAAENIHLTDDGTIIGLY